MFRDVTNRGTASDSVVEALILDLLQWLERRERSYEEVMGAWRTSCPRLQVWEDASDRGLVASERVDGREFVRITTSGRALLERRGKSRRLEGESR